MKDFEIIKCHGSGNDFIMVDTTRDESIAALDWSSFARVACNRESGIGSDGLLLVVKHSDGIYGMDMLNPDGTHAAMCGNGLRSVARLARERGYLDRGVLRSGGRLFPARQVEQLAKGIETYAVEIPIAMSSPDFAFFAEGESFVGRKIEALDEELRFTALNLGNPHIVAAVERIDMQQLERLGECVKGLKSHFPNGVNVSLYEPRSPRSIFVATYERGAGITLSCGTGMTASATAAAMLGLIEGGSRIDVCNHGGKVVCTTRIEDDGVVTELEGNATFDWVGRASFVEGVLSYSVDEQTEEDVRWREFVATLNK